MALNPLGGNPQILNLLQTTAPPTHGGGHGGGHGGAHNVGADRSHAPFVAAVKPKTTTDRSDTAEAARRNLKASATNPDGSNKQNGQKSGKDGAADPNAKSNVGPNTANSLFLNHLA